MMLYLNCKKQNPVDIIPNTEGYVKEYFTKIPIPNATIILTKRQPTGWFSYNILSRDTAITDSAGYFKVAGRQYKLDGTDDVEIYAMGYYSHSIYGGPRDGNTFFLDVPAYIQYHIVNSIPTTARYIVISGGFGEDDFSINDGLNKDTIIYSVAPAYKNIHFRWGICKYFADTMICDTFSFDKIMESHTQTVINLKY